jgi:hypothetical protein
LADVALLWTFVGFFFFVVFFFFWLTYDCLLRIIIVLGRCWVPGATVRLMEGELLDLDCVLVSFIVPLSTTLLISSRWFHCYRHFGPEVQWSSPRKMYVVLIENLLEIH